MAGLATPHLAFAFPPSLPHFHFSFTLAPRGLRCRWRWLGTGRTLRIMVGEEVRVGARGGGLHPGLPPLHAAASRLSSRQPLGPPSLLCPPGPSGLLKVCPFPIETVFMAPRCPGVKPKGPKPKVKACALGPGFPRELTSQLWELLSFS